MREPVASATGASLIPMLFMFCDKASLELDTILRIRMGLFTKNDAYALHHNPHVDFVEPHYTAVYYVNDCDGDPFIFYDTFQTVRQDQSPTLAAHAKLSIAK